MKATDPTPRHTGVSDRRCTYGTGWDAGGCEPDWALPDDPPLWHLPAGRPVDDVQLTTDARELL